MTDTSPVLRRADYHLTEEEQSLSETFAAFFAKACPIERVRRAQPLGFDQDLWQSLGDLRPVALGLSEEVGGDGGGLGELILLAEEVGRVLAPVPVIESVVAARLLAAAAPADAIDRLRPMIDGSRIVSLALDAGPGRHLVPAGAIAQEVIFSLNDGLVISADHTNRTPVRNQGDAPLAWWEVTDRSDHAVLIRGDRAHDLFRRAQREWKLLTGATFVGMADASLRIGVEFARTRITFGAPIGANQAVAHPLADVAMGVETARRLIRKAAWYAQHTPDHNGHLVPLAYLYAEEVASKATQVAVHVLGGVGFTEEADAQLYFRRVKGWGLVGGDPAASLLEASDYLFADYL